MVPERIGRATAFSTHYLALGPAVLKSILSLSRLLSAPAAALLLVAGVVGCSAERGSLVGHTYDNVVARDNAYFLAREKMRATEVTLYAARVNDYNRVLPLFPTVDDATVKRISADMEDIIKKASLPIQHRPGSDWTDDSYILVGKARYYKAEYEDAAKTFKYVNTTSKDPNARHEALIWLMRTFLATKELESAGAVSDLLDKEQGTPLNARELFLTRAEYFLRVGEEAKAIEQLEKAVPLVTPKNEQSRTRYILAQLYQAQGQDKKAYAELNHILKKNPPYELDFFAKLMLGQVSDLNQTDRTRLDKYFAKLLKDTKNKEYRDKIYYEMARLEYRQQRYPEALALLQRSARTTTTNRAQKSYTYLLSGRIYYENLQKYRLAAAYYDSTVQNLPQELPEYAAISERAAILKDFARQLTVIETQDSLQALARLDTATLRTRLTAYAQAELDEQRSKNEALAAQQASLEQRGRQTQLGVNNARDLQTGINSDDFLAASTGDKWYFDNPTALGSARTEFIRKWGDRPLQDNWRIVTQISNSPVTQQGGNVPVSIAGNTSTSVNPTGAGAQEQTPQDPAVQLNALVAQYRQNLPLTSPSLKLSQELIQEALFNLGGIYNQELREPLPAAETYEKLLARFPDGQHTPETLYILYLLYKDRNEAGKAEGYAQQLRQRFPSSSYARLVADPEYLRRTSVATAQVAILVDSAFTLYKKQDFTKASSVLSQAKKQYPENDLNDRVAFLSTLLTIRTQPPATAKAAVEKFYKDYPQSPLANQAVSMINTYKQYEAGQISGTLASTDKPVVSMFRPGEVENRMRIYYKETPTAPASTPALTPTTKPANTPATSASPTSAAPVAPATAPITTPTVATDSAATRASTPATPAVDPAKAARMAAAQARARGKKPAVAPKTKVPAEATPAPVAAVPAPAPVAGTPAPQPPAPTTSTPAASVPTAPSRPSTAYKADLSAQHVVVLVFPKGAASLQTLPDQLGVYNSRFFKANNLQVQQQPLNDTQDALIISSLAGAKVAQSYALKLRGPQSPVSKLRGAGYQTLVIGIDNLPLLLQTKDLEGYQRFYQQTYR